MPVGSSLLVAELDFKGVRHKLFDDGAYLTSHEPIFRQIFGQRHDVVFAGVKLAHSVNQALLRTMVGVVCVAVGIFLLVRTVYSGTL